jgi:hypothetical protein
MVYSIKGGPAGVIRALPGKWIVLCTPPQGWP